MRVPASLSPRSSRDTGTNGEPARALPSIMTVASYPRPNPQRRSCRPCARQSGDPFRELTAAVTREGATTLTVGDEGGVLAFHAGPVKGADAEVSVVVEYPRPIQLTPLIVAPISSLPGARGGRAGSRRSPDQTDRPAPPNHGVHRPGPPEVDLRQNRHCHPAENCVSNSSPGSTAPDTNRGSAQAPTGSSWANKAVGVDCELGRQHRVRSAPRGQELEIVIHHRMAKLHTHPPSGRRGSNQTRDQDIRASISGPGGTTTHRLRPATPRPPNTSPITPISSHMPATHRRER